MNLRCLLRRRPKVAEPSVTERLDGFADTLLAKARAEQVRAATAVNRLEDAVRRLEPPRRT